MKHGIFMAKIAQGNGEINFNKLDFMGIKDLWINEKLWDDIWIKGDIPIDLMDVELDLWLTNCLIVN